MPLVQANGINIEYEVDGSGEPLVLIAGLGYDRWVWHRMVPGLAAHFQVISFDNRGVGGSDKPAGPYTAQLLAEDTVALLNALEVPSAAVLGHSMGGFVAQALALSDRERVNRLILSATHFGGPNHIHITQEALVVLMDGRGDPVERLRHGIRVSTAPGFVDRQPDLIADWIAYRREHPVPPHAYEAQLAVGLALFAEEASFEHKLTQSDIPTLILSGDSDRVVPTGNADLLARQIPGSEVVILPNTGHFYPLEAPEAAVAAIVGFMERTASNQQRARKSR